MPEKVIKPLNFEQTLFYQHYDDNLSSLTNFTFTQPCKSFSVTHLQEEAMEC